MKAVLAAGFIFTTLTLGVLVAGLANNPKPLTMTVTPHVAHAPAHVRIELFVPRHSANRNIVVMCTGPDFYRSSIWDLEGENASAVFLVEYNALPAGDYEVEAQLASIEGLRARAVTVVAVY